MRSTVELRLTIPGDVHHRLRAIAAEHDASMKGLIIEVLEAGVEERPVRLEGLPRRSPGNYNSSSAPRRAVAAPRGSV